MMSPFNYDYHVLVKTLLIGDAGVGKTAFCTKLCDGKFLDTYTSTLGVDFFVKYMDLNNKIFKIQIWDTAGQERFQSIITSYFKNAKLAIIMLDLNREYNKIKLEYWIDKIQRYCPENVKIIVIGNKKDLKCNTNLNEINDICKLNNIDFIKISVKKDNTFEEFQELIYKLIYDLPPNYKEFYMEEQKVKQGCCNIL
jgi:Ras-related protein Rab-1A